MLATDDVISDIPICQVLLFALNCLPSTNDIPICQHFRRLLKPKRRTRLVCAGFCWFAANLLQYGDDQFDALYYFQWIDSCRRLNLTQACVASRDVLSPTDIQEMLGNVILEVISVSTVCPQLFACLNCLPVSTNTRAYPTGISVPALSFPRQGGQYVDRDQTS